MLAVEIVLIIVGVIILIGSFFVEEKLSQEDIEHITLLSEKELKIIAEKQVKKVEVEVENSIEEIIDESLEITKRGLEKETNAKIMAVSEYSDTVLENINKTHNEITFLYSMLNDKQNETAEIVGDLQRYTKRIIELEEQLQDTMVRVENTSSAETTPEVVEAVGAVLTAETVVEKKEGASTEMKTDVVSEEALPMSKNEKILFLYKKGKDEVEIAKALDCGLGEVRLVLGLYNEV